MILFGRRVFHKISGEVLFLFFSLRKIIYVKIVISVALYISLFFLDMEMFSESL